MRALILCAVFSIASAKPGYGGYLSSGWDAPSLSSLSYHQQPAVQFAQPIVHQVVAPQVASYVHAPVAVAKPAATSYSSFQRVIQPSTLVHAAPMVHAPVVQAAPVIHAPVISQPLLHSYSEPSFVSSLGGLGGLEGLGGLGGHGW